MMEILVHLMHHALLTVKQMKNFVLEEYCQMVAQEVINV